MPNITTIHVIINNILINLSISILLANSNVKHNNNIGEITFLNEETKAVIETGYTINNSIE